MAEGMDILDYVEIMMARCRNEGEDTLSKRRQYLLSQYYRKTYLSSKPGYSRFVTSEVRDTLEWARGPIMKAIIGSNKVVEFRPMNPDAAAIAEEETLVTNRRVLHSQNGYEVINMLVDNAMLYPNAYAKVLPIDTIKDIRFEEVRSITAMDVDNLEEQLKDDDNAELVEIDEEEVELPTQEGIEKLTLFNVKIRRYIKKKDIEITTVAPENMFIDPDHCSLDLDDCKFTAELVETSVSELRKMGFKVDDDESGYTAFGYDYTGEKASRRRQYSNWNQPNNNRTGSQEQINALQAYVVFDEDGDGIAELRRLVILSNENVIINEYADMNPYISTTCIIMPDQHQGISLAMMASEEQDFGTTITRNTLNNIILNLKNKLWVNVDMFTDDGATEIAAVSPDAALVPVLGPPQNAIFPEPTNAFTNHLLALLQDHRAVVPKRTGVVPETGIDPEMLQQANVGTYLSAQDKNSERIENVIRTIAETGIKKIFIKYHALLRKNPEIVGPMMVNGQMITPNVTRWQDDPEADVTVGLGFLNKQQKVMAVQAMLQTQMLLLQNGSLMVDENRIYNTMEMYSDALGIGPPTTFAIDPKSQEMAQRQQQQAQQQQAQQQAAENAPQNVLMLQNMQLELAVKQQQMQETMTKLQIERDKAYSDIELDREKHQTDVMKLEKDIEKLDVDIRNILAQIQSTDVKTIHERAKTLKTVDDIESSEIHNRAEAITAIAAAERGRQNGGGNQES